MDAIVDTLQKGSDLIEGSDESNSVLILGYPDITNDTITNILTNSSESQSNGLLRIVSDDTNDILYYVIPGFGTSRESTTGIITNHLIKSVTDHASSIEFLFTINQNSFDNLLPLVTQASRLIKNVELLKNNIALVVTDATGVSREKTIEILHHNKRRISRDGNAVKLMEIFEQRFTLLTDNDNNLKELMTNLTFASDTSKDLDFVLSLPAQSFVRVTNAMKNINERITRNAKSLLSVIANYYIGKEKTIVDQKEFQKLLQTAIDEIKETINSIKSKEISPEQFSRKLRDLCFKLGIQFIQDHSTEINNENSKVEFLRMYETPHTNFKTINWISPLEELSFRINELYQWSGILYIIQDRLSYHPFHAKPLELKNLLPKRESIKKFSQLKPLFKKIFDREKIFGYESMKDLKIDGPRLGMLRKIIDSSFENKISRECSSDNEVVTIKGNFIRTSEIDWNYECSGETTRFRIFAKRILYVDTNVKAESLIMIAPTWVFVGTKKFYVNEFFGIGYDFHNKINQTGLIELREPTKINIEGESKSEFLDAINNYKIYIYGNKRVYHELYNNPNINELYETNDYTNEILQLEENFHQDIEAYKSLSKRIEQYYTKENLDDSHKQLVQYAYALCSSKIWAATNKMNDNLIIDMSGYLNGVMENVKKLQSDQQINKIQVHVKDYNKNIDEELKSVSDFMKNTLKPSMEKMQNNVNEQVKKLLDEIKDRQDRMKENNKEIAKSKEEYKNVFFMKTALKMFSGIASVVGNFVPVVGPIVGQAVSMGASTIGSAINSPEIPETNPALPESVLNASNEMKKYVDDNEQSRENNLEKQIEILREANDTLCNDMVQKLSNFAKNVDPEKVRSVLDKAAERASPNSLKALNTAKGVAVVLDVMGDISAYGGAMSSFDAAIAQNNKQIKQYEKFKNVCDDILVHGYEETKKLSGETMDRMSSGSISLNEQWSMETKLGEMQKFMKKLSADFSVNKEITELWQGMETVLARFGKSYEQMKAFNKDKKLSNLMMNMKGVEESTTSQELEDMALRIKYSVVYGQYSRVVQALKQIGFPLGVSYYTGNSLAAKSKNTTELIGTVIKEIGDLRAKWELSQVTVTEMNKKTISTTFSSRPWGHAKPFYQWPNKDYGYEIKKLIAGQEIILKADVGKSLLPSAVKFRRVELLFNSNNSIVQKEIDEIKPPITIQIVHSGFSHYRCGTQVYTFYNQPQTLTHAYNTWDKDEKCPELANVAYIKLNKAQPLLSPYTNWIIKLTQYGDAQRKVLHKYRDEIDLELGGQGSYIDEAGASICTNELIGTYPLDLQLSSELNMGLLGGGNKSPPTLGCIPKDININGTMLLVDVFLKRCTKRSMKSMKPDTKEVGPDRAMIGAINVIEEFDKRLKKLRVDLQVSRRKTEFDPCAAIEPLKSSLLNNDCDQSREILRNSINITLRGRKKTKFDNGLQELIEQLLY